jgi:hypothetical protein
VLAEEDGPRFLDLFSGVEHRVGSSMAGLGWSVLLVERDLGSNILDDLTYEALLVRAKRGFFRGAASGSPCETLTYTRRPPFRSLDYPLGLPHLRGELLKGASGH